MKSDPLSGATKISVLPYSPSIDRWTEDHYKLYSLFELAVGNRKELSKEELREIEAAKEVEELIDSGDPNWLQKVQDIMAENDFGSFEISEDLFQEINEEQLRRGE